MKGITLNKNALAYCLYGEGFTPEDLPNSITKVAELEQVIQTFENAKMCQGVCIVNNSRITITRKLFASDTCYKEMQSRNIWKSYKCENLINVTEQEKSKAKQRCCYCDKLKAYVSKLLWKEKNQSLRKTVQLKMAIKNSKRILARKVTKLKVSVNRLCETGY